MVIRDDRRGKPRQVIPVPEIRDGRIVGYGQRTLDAPDYVLYDCPECGRSHFVTVDECPTAEVAAAETARVDGRKAA